MTGTARFESFNPLRSGWRAAFSHPRAEHVARRLEDVLPVVRQADLAAAAGSWAVVLVAYEAAPAFDPAFVTHESPACGVPLAWVAVFDEAHEPTPSASHGPGAYAVGPWQPLVERARYAAGFASIEDRITAGDTYQVNYTFPLRAAFAGDPRAWFADLCTAQQAGYCAHVDLGRHQVLSLSPELFVERTGARLVSRPMKGTARRGRWLDDDDRAAVQLATSEKARAENVMIVDLIRNDLGRLAPPGRVRVPALFTAERYPTLWQLTSTVEACCADPPALVDVLAALFPCGSVTGAPKIRTTQIVREVEPFPRGVYTGAVGFVRPGGDFVLNVAIRTVVVDLEAGDAHCGVGSGVTADSDADGEYQECLLKADFLTRARPAFSLLESLRLEDGAYARLDRHLDRMAESARYFGVSWSRQAAREALEACRRPHASGTWKVRLLASQDGGFHTESSPIDRSSDAVWKIALAPAPVDAHSCWLHHKTTNRQIYDQAKSARPGADDVVLWNDRGEVTETTIANLVVGLDGRLWTPPRDCGLLAGTYRAALLDEGTIAERRISAADLHRAGEVFLVNSVRGLWRAVLVSDR